MTHRTYGWPKRVIRLAAPTTIAESGPRSVAARMKGRNETEISTWALNRTLWRSVTAATSAKRPVASQGPIVVPDATNKPATARAAVDKATAQA
jgi:hypothetical protein